MNFTLRQFLRVLTVALLLSLSTGAGSWLYLHQVSLLQSVASFQLAPFLEALKPYAAAIGSYLWTSAAASLQTLVAVAGEVNHFLATVCLSVGLIGLWLLALRAVIGFLQSGSKDETDKPKGFNLDFNFVRFNQSSLGGFGSNPPTANNLQVETVVDIPTRFDDVAGIDEVRSDLSDLVSFLKEPERYTEYGAKLPKGVLLSGPPGTGKTLLARAIAGEAGGTFIPVAAAELTEVFVGVGAARLRRVFEVAAANAPAIIFIDEIDTIGRQRNKGHGELNSEREQTLTQLLTLMDGFTATANILVIGATNNPEVLDTALLRPGRFDRKLTLRLPDRHGRMQILNVHIAGKRINLGPDWLEDTARKTIGASGADLATLLNEAAIAAVKRQAPGIEPADIDYAIERTLVGLARPRKVISDREKRTLAVHETGHAIATHALRHVASIGTPKKVTILPTGDAEGYTLSFPNEEQVLTYQADIRAKLVVLMAGRAAESMYASSGSGYGSGDISLGAADDYRRASMLADHLVRTNATGTLLGPLSNQRSLSDESSRLIERKIETLLGQAYKVARYLLLLNQATLQRVYILLIEHETLEGDFLSEALSEMHDSHSAVSQSVQQWLKDGQYDPAIDTMHQDALKTVQSNGQNHRPKPLHA